MHETEKPKRSPKLGFLRSCLAFLLYPLIVFKVLVSILVFWAIGGYVKPSLDPQYIPTAEYLLENPIEEPIAELPIEELTEENFIENMLALHVRFSATRSTENRLCFHVSSGSMGDFYNLRWAELYINEQVVNRYNLVLPREIFTSNPAHAYPCYDGHLESGLHIIEFRAKESLFAEPYYIHRWAIEIP
jgi:hypothetical protein